LTKRIQTGGAPRAGVGAPAPDEEALDSPLENLLKQVIQGQTPARIKQEVSTPAGTSGIKPKPRRLLPETPKTVKKPASSAKPSRIPRPISSGKKSKSGGLKQSVLSGAKKGFLRGIGLDPQSIDDDLNDEEGGYSPKKVTKKQKKRKPTAAERLKPWEEWKNPSRRRLSYDKNWSQQDQDLQKATWLWLRHSETVGQDGHRISLAGLSVHGTGHQTEKMTGPRRSWDQSFGPNI